MPLSEDLEDRFGLFGNTIGAVGSNAGIDLRQDVESSNKDVADSEPGRRLAAQLQMTHPDYDTNVLKWRKYLDLYEANDVYRYISKHIRESSDTWQKRVERGYYVNYVASVVDLFTSYLFAAPIDRKIPTDAASTEFFDEFYKDSDLSGTQYLNFLVRACAFAMVEGHVGILVDLPKAPERGFRNEQERKDANHRPFLSILHAHQIMDWELDDFGNFNWVKLEIKRPQERNWDEPVDETVRNFVVWTKEDWTEYELRKANSDSSDDPNAEVARVVDAGVHNLGRVPLVIVRLEKQARHAWFGVSSVRDIADINIAILNWSSLGDEEIFERCLNVLAMQEGPQGDSPIELTHGNILLYAQDGDAPSYLVPGTSPLQLIGDWIGRHEDQILRLAKLKGPTGMEDVRSATSGIAYAFEFNETNQTLAKKAIAMQQAEVEIHKLVVQWIPDAIPPFTGEIEYPKEFGVGDVLTEFQAMTLARSNFTSETARKEFEKRLARKIFATSDTKLRQQIVEEIESGSSEDTLEATFGMSPPSSMRQRIEELVGARDEGEGNQDPELSGDNTEDATAA